MKLPKFSELLYNINNPGHSITEAFANQIAGVSKKKVKHTQIILTTNTSQIHLDLKKT